MGKLRKNQKSYLTIGVITLAAVIVLAGISYRQSKTEETDEQEAVIMAESERTEDAASDDRDPALSDTAGDEGGDSAPSDAADEDSAAVSGSAEEDKDASKSGDNAASSEKTDMSGMTDGSTQGASSIEGTTEETVETMASTAALSFSESDVLRWPLQGDILINYSMDESVYFATLDQYKYNPAMIIRGDVNAQVSAAAAGQVTGIETTAETGETVTMDIGNGYQLVYGQLKDLQVAEGDFVETGDLIGYVSEPTKYYSVEGSNLYFAMTKNGEPVNPLNYLE
ncbi:MAG: peptidoglycan DD-metalloendopeptidase family protein [Clostridiales bacterium]|nr:peptidoglycan DD-metalloendopeptidase family protein [Clostridiales bacterium]